MTGAQASLSVNIAFDQCGLFFVTSPDVKGMLIAAKGLDEAVVKVAGCLRDFAELGDPTCKAFLATTHDPGNRPGTDQRIARVVEVLINRLPFTDARDDMHDLARVVVALAQTGDSETAGLPSPPLNELVRQALDMQAGGRYINGRVFHGLVDEIERSEKVAAALGAVAKAYEAWEAGLVFEGNWNNGLPALTQPLFDRLLEIQAMRNAALAVPRPGAIA